MPATAPKTTAATPAVRSATTRTLGQNSASNTVTLVDTPPKSTVVTLANRAVVSGYGQ